MLTLVGFLFKLLVTYSTTEKISLSNKDRKPKKSRVGNRGGTFKLKYKTTEKLKQRRMSVKHKEETNSKEKYVTKRLGRRKSQMHR